MASAAALVEAAVQTSARRAFVSGAYWWNHRTIQGLFSAPAGSPVFCAGMDEAIAGARREGGRVIAWATRLEPRHEALCEAHAIELLRIEDGFVRSIGLGAGFAPAASLAVDGRGIYYDPTRPSDLEHLLQNVPLGDEQRAEGARIRRRIVELRLSKYNLNAGSGVRVNARGRKIILVPGQVIDDASVLSAAARTIDLSSSENVNAQLLRHARSRNPEAYIIYKVHPDVRHGLRKGHLGREEARSLADLVVDDVDITTLIDMCDGVETMTSLAGFEALLRGKSVTVHGLPFYAGWGLTSDLARCPRRTTRRTIDELCYIAFVHYTRHVHPMTGRACSIHELLDALHILRQSRWHRLRTTALRHYARFCEFIVSKP